MQVVKCDYVIFEYNEKDEMIQVIDGPYNTVKEAEEVLLYEYPIDTEAFVGTVTYARLYPAERVKLSGKIACDELPTF